MVQKKLEKDLYKGLRTRLSPESSVGWLRIEAKQPLGMPDLLIMERGKIVLVELKVVRAGAKVNLSPHQVAFADRASRLGVPLYLLVQHWPKEVFRAGDSTIFAYRAAQLVEVAKRGISVKAWRHWTLNDASGLQEFLKSV